MRRLIIGLLLVGTLSGCAQESSAVESGGAGSSAAPVASRRLVLETSAADLPAAVASFRFSGRDAQDRPVYGPLVRARAGVVTLEGLPAELVTLQVEGLGAGGVLADYVTSLDPRQSLVTLDNPPFLDPLEPRRESFIVLGCNRLNYEDQQRTPSSANSAQLLADFRELPERFNPRPGYVFFTGDLVMAEDHAPLLAQQLTSWKTLFASANLPIPLAAMPGNHELLYYSEALKNEIPDPPCGEVWSTLMAPFIPGADGPTMAAPNLDHLERDESRLSYTFRSGSNYYIVVNTETWEGGLTPADTGKVPLHWIQQKLAQAEADPTIRDVFVFGHKPVFVLGLVDPLPNINPEQSLPFYALLNASPKVRAYLCAHAHLWQVGVPTNAPAGSRLPQLVAGNAGSDLDPTFVPGYFGYTVIHQMASGRITAESWGRPIPVPYYDQATPPPSTIRERFTLYRP